ncbi:extracellular solute-binding protein [Nostoc sp. CCY0012]|uniref:extracellular solute-binding protein n=1 Tax=Nostoc sp. CCY0012 TaxID=1056123 RepID=UPI0039C66F57
MYNPKFPIPNPKSLDRRSFLIGASGLALSQLLVGCGGGNQTQLNVRLLQGSIPSQVVSQFRRSLQQRVQLQFTPIEQIQEIFRQLQGWQQKPNTTNDPVWTRFLPFGQSETVAASNLVTLGDYWLRAAIEQKLIQPLTQPEIQQLKNWTALDQRWQQLVTRNAQGNLDTQGQVWAAPYRWGSTMIVYHRERLQRLGLTPQDWSDLWRNELRSRISLLNQPREVIGLVLKKLGNSYNTENLDTIPDLEQELRTLNQQVKFYSSNNYLQPLITGDTWLAVGWSSDIMPVLARYPQLSAVIPQSGTAMWADLWVRPTKAAQDTISSQWIDFCWQPNIAQQISVLTRSNSPIFPDIVPADIQQPFRGLLQSNRETFSKSEFLLPLPPEVIKQYEALFTQMKQA